MRKLTAIALILTLTLVPSMAQAKDKKASAPKEDIAAKQEARRSELVNTEWPVKLVPEGKTAKEALSDKLVFSGNTVQFQTLTSKGFGALTYDVRAYEGRDAGTWETYSSLKNGEETLSIRGDWQGTQMDGVVSIVRMKNKKSDVETYTFSTREKTEIKPADEAAAAQTAPAAASAPGKALVSKESAPDTR